MKLYLASIMEPENFGPGRLIGVTTGNKPKEVSIKYDKLIPEQILQEEYYKLSATDKELAGKHFREGFSKQLDEFYNKAVKAAESKTISPIELLPFQEGDTLVSWERKAYTHYRGLIANILKKFGYEVVEN